MIKSFKCKHAKAIFEGVKSRKYIAVRKAIERKLQMLDSAASLEFLLSTPGNNLEALRGDRSGQYSIRINKQWRLCFV